MAEARGVVDRRDFDQVLEEVAAEAGLVRQSILGPRVYELLKQRWNPPPGFEALEERVSELGQKYQDLAVELRARISDAEGAIWERIESLVEKIEFHEPALQVDVPPVPDTDLEFMECDVCRSKPGSPTLCSGCVRNRGVIARLKRSVASGREEGGYPPDPHAGRKADAYREALCRLVRAAERASDKADSNLSQELHRARFVLGEDSFCAVCGNLFREATVTTTDSLGRKVHVKGAAVCTVLF